MRRRVRGVTGACALVLAAAGAAGACRSRPAPPTPPAAAPVAPATADATARATPPDGGRNDGPASLAPGTGGTCVVVGGFRDEEWDRATKLAARTQAAGFAGAGVFDGALFRNFATDIVVIAASFADGKDARAAAARAARKIPGAYAKPCAPAGAPPRPLARRPERAAAALAEITPQADLPAEVPIGCWGWSAKHATALCTTGQSTDLTGVHWTLDVLGGAPWDEIVLDDREERSGPERRAPPKALRRIDAAVRARLFLAGKWWQHGAMDQLQGMKVFVRVAQRAGFAAAARDLKLSPAAVTKHVAALESRVRARLFERTTRSVSLTEAGRAYLERCLECLQAFDDADAAVNQLADRPAGLLRVTAPVDIGASVMAALSAYMQSCPDVTVDLQLSNRPVDLVDEGFDVALRIAPSLTGAYVARQLAITGIAILAAPEYLRRHGRPERPEDLAKHRATIFTEPRPRDEWVLERAGLQVPIKLKPAMLSNSARAVQAAAREGVGLLLIPSLSAVEDVAAGMEPLLLDWTVLPQLRLYALYPHRRFLPAKVRVFVETLREALGDPGRDPWWPAIMAGASKRKRRG